MVNKSIHTMLIITGIIFFSVLLREVGFSKDKKSGRDEYFYGVIVKLPKGFDVAVVGEEKYYVYDHIFYLKGPYGYEIVPAPEGAEVDEIPEHVKEIIARGEIYYYHNEVFYEPVDTGYEIVKAPPGAVIDELPKGYSTIVVSGIVHYVNKGIYYRQVPSGYVIMEQPQDPVTVKDLQKIPDGDVMIVAGLLNVRSGPGTNFSVVQKIRQNMIVEIYGRAQDWLYIKLHSGEYGWIMEKFSVPATPGADG